MKKKTSIDINGGLMKVVCDKLNLSDEFIKLTDKYVPFGFEAQDTVRQYLNKSNPNFGEDWVEYWLDDKYDEIIQKYGTLQNFYDESYAQSCIEVLRKIITELRHNKYTFEWHEAK